LLRTSVERFRAIAFIEGVSYLLLLGVAMPLKYFAGFPGAVMAVGWAHGVLFVLYLVALAEVSFSRRWRLVQHTPEHSLPCSDIKDVHLCIPSYNEFPPF